MTGDLRSSILTTAAVAVSVAGLTLIQPLTAAPPLLLAAMLMDRDDSGQIDGVSGIADAIQGRLMPSDGKTVIVNFLTGPFGLWNPLDESDGFGGTVPSTTLGVASSMPFLNQQGWNVTPPPLPPLAPGVLPVIPPAAPGATFAFDLPSLQIGEAVVPTPPVGPFPVPSSGEVFVSTGYDLTSYAAVSMLNPLALSNSVAAYLNRALSPVQVNPDGTVTCRLGLSCSDIDVTTEKIDGVLYVTFKNPDGTIVKAKIETRNGRTYVTYEDDGSLPLVRPLRDYFGLLGNELADVLEPALTALVYWGYRDATNGTGGLLPTPAETIKALLDFVVGVKEGIESLFVPHGATINVQSLLPTTDLTPTTDPDEDEVVDPGEDNKKPQSSAPTTPVEEPQEEPLPSVDPDEPTSEEPVEEPVDEDTELPAEEPGDDDAEETPDVPADTGTDAPDEDDADSDTDEGTGGSGEDRDGSYSHADESTAKDQGEKSEAKTSEAKKDSPASSDSAG